MRELKETGYMSNRGRQNVASFFTKDMGNQDWRLGAEVGYYLQFVSSYLILSACTVVRVVFAGLRCHLELGVSNQRGAAIP